MYTNAFGVVTELGGERQLILEARVLLITLVYVEAGVDGQNGLVHQVEVMAVTLTHQVEYHGWLVSTRLKGEVLLAKMCVSGRHVKAQDPDVKIFEWE